jgi:hypothetical protein
MYKYQDEKVTIFTDQGQRRFLAIRDHVNKLLDQAGAVRLQEAISPPTGCTWHLMACVDRMVELGELREVTDSTVAGQHRIFTR